MSTGIDSKQVMTCMPHYWTAVEMLSTAALLGVVLLFVAKTVMHAQYMAASTLDAVNTGAQVTAYITMLFFVHRMAAHLAPACAVAPVLARLAL